MKWKSKVTGQEVKVKDGWNEEEYRIVLSFTGFEDRTSWFRLKYSEFIEAFEKVEE